jgi:drug/metabolite transporter (DMT)-like permease
MYAALEYGPVTIVSSLIAGYPLVTLLLSRAFLRKEDVGPQLITGVTSAVCGVVLLLGLSHAVTDHPSHAGPIVTNDHVGE